MYFMSRVDLAYMTHYKQTKVKYDSEIDRLKQDRCGRKIKQLIINLEKHGGS